MDGALHTTDPRGQAARAIARIGGRDDRARRAALRAGLYQPCTWAVFQALSPAGQAGALAALEFCRDAEEAADAVQAAALLSLDPRRQAASAQAARRRGMPEFSPDDPDALARNGKSRARREHTARARGAAAPTDANLPDNDAGEAPRGRREPPTLDELTGAPLLLLLRAEAEDADDDCCAAVQAGAALLAAKPPRPRGRPTRTETLKAHGQQQLPGLAPGGSTTRSNNTTRAVASPPPPAPAQLDLWGRP